MADQQNPQQVNAGQAVLGLAIFGAALWFFFGGGLEQQTARSMDAINSQVAADAVNQYNIAARSGGPIDRCVHAGLVAAAYLQAEDETNYRLCKQREQNDCDAAGMPR